MTDDENALEEAMITDHEQRRVNENLGSIRLDDTQDVLQLPEFHFEAEVEHELAPHQVDPAPMEAEVEEARAPEAPAPHLAAARLKDLEIPGEVDPAPIEDEVEHPHQVNQAHMVVEVVEAPAPHLAAANAYMYHSNLMNQDHADIWTRLFYNPFRIGLDPRSCLPTTYKCQHLYHSGSSMTQVETAPAPPQLTHNNPSRARLDPRSVIRRSRNTGTVTPYTKEERDQKIQNWRKKRPFLNYRNQIRYEVRQQQAARKTRKEGRFVTEIATTSSHPAEPMSTLKSRRRKAQADYNKDHEIRRLYSTICQLKQEIHIRDTIIRTLRERELHLPHIATGQESSQAGIMQLSQPPNQQPHPPLSHQHVEPAGGGPPATQDQRAEEGGGDPASDSNKGGE
ncbi:hypothetical protein FCM35_KLT16976 [Carex littledalei]|uniref:CCT domain-containing protein n=1 Tax=Carex littledalei TaxID=544730 RepID=A0A833R7F1_9POAL|nr:hypothetical protein FCM35_KLT16976 [Carex littledalei]